MMHLLRFLPALVVACALAASLPAYATDVDGPDDCQRFNSDFGDAPEFIAAYSGVMGRFPTCTAAGPAGTRELACAPISSMPGPTGYVRNVNSMKYPRYWLGCVPGTPLGIDAEVDGKVSLSAGASTCNSNQSVDCFEVAFSISFGQDECYGSDDAGLASPVVFPACGQSSVTFLTYSCNEEPIEVVLNILVDWNQDGDWNDNFMCPAGCAYEWAVKNVPIMLPPGCSTVTSPLFLAGPNQGRGWMRITISDENVADDFPWNGGVLPGGETEDYPVTIAEEEDPCPEYEDFGDAPEEVQAYVGVTGHFPTCTFSSNPGTQELACAPLSTAPMHAGFVRHARSAFSSLAFWLGCGTPGVDGEHDGKMNDTGAPQSACDQTVAIDCVEPWWLRFGQDECYGDGVDAGIQVVPAFTACQPGDVTFDAFNCTATDVGVYLNILVDWNRDGDWNDNFMCPAGACAYEWAVKNVPILLPPGCSTQTSPQFLAGPYVPGPDEIGEGWLRITLTERPVSDDFPWAGSVGETNDSYDAGETEDYPVTIEPGDECESYEDFGDAPEDAQAYIGVPGHFPTCTFGSNPGTQEIACTPALSTVPGTTGYVEHVRNPGDPNAFWLGCVSPGVDGEHDGKMNDTGAPQSACDQTVAIDCVESWWLQFGQDECYGDGVDAGIQAPITFTACQPGAVTFDAFNCGATDVYVYLNILVDWNRDGDWNDNFLCAGGACAYEWAVKNVAILLPPGCTTQTSPQFLAGPYVPGPDEIGEGWLRITLTERPVNDDFPWAGSVTDGPGVYDAGETEDYPVIIEPGDECQIYDDFGDAPEEVDAYLGVPGHFPTCRFGSTPGTQELACTPPLSTAPGTTGYVEHVRNAGDPYAFWLGCGTPGVDSEHDGKMNNTGAPQSACDQTVAIDCVESWWLSFGQDECYGDGVDAGIQSPITFTACQPGDVTFDAFNCGPEVEVYLNILVDWNRDGDWNDNFMCTGGVCAYEWAIKNHPITLPPGCTTLTSPQFLAGPYAPGPGETGEGWLRITITPAPVSDDFPWAGSIGEPDDLYKGGETEDYPVTIESGEPCEPYQDFGDAPEDAQAYIGVPGRFPTCTTPSPPGTQELACPPVSTAPNQTGYVEHLTPAGYPRVFWLGCGVPGVDSEADGKMNDTGASTSRCNPGIPVDCVEPAFGLNFGQDECTGDGVDAGIQAPITFSTCTLSSVRFDAFNCRTAPVDAWLNILVDWNHDGDWNDNFLCPDGSCAYEWAVKNVQITLPPGCQTLTSPQFITGPAMSEAGEGWLRITISDRPAPDDFPWDGTASAPDGPFKAGETEDYPVHIESGECDIGYEDFGDAPEDDAAYPAGTPGRFPTCLFPTPAGTQEIQCGLPRSTVPGATGFVRHVAMPWDPMHFWLGCGPSYPGGVDSEPDGKTDAFPMAPLTSHCDPSVVPDCTQLAFGGMMFAQDECPGDGVDAGVTGPFSFTRCGTEQVHFDATNCGPVDIEVYLNILVDWNYDGDWNDNIQCAAGAACAFEWAVKNHPITLNPGCNPYTSPSFNTGPNGVGWMRVTLTADPVPDDFPWNGSAGVPGEVFRGGETEDYPVVIPPYTGAGDPDIPGSIWLGPTWPNPGRTFTLVRYALPRETHVDLVVFDVGGRKVRTLVNGVEAAGEHAVRWDYRTDEGGRAPAGLYLVALTAEGRVLTQRTIRID